MGQSLRGALRVPTPAVRRGAPVLLGDRLRDRANNFDLLRLVAALAVIVSHSFALVGDAEPLHHFHTTLGSTAVLVFFAVSGLLVRRSWEHDPRPRAYWTKRVLRMWPALAVGTTATALVLGPLVTTAPLRDYFSSWETWTYPVGFLLMSPFGAELPGVFAHHPVARTVNGSLWTLHVEVMAYALLFLMAWSGLLRRRLTLTVLTSVMVLWAASIATPSQPDLGAVNAVAAFAVGACAYSWRDQLVLSHRGALLAFATCCAAAEGPDALRVATWTVGAAYLSLWFACGTPVLVSPLTRWGDASYGLYIFAYPVQQTLVQALGRDTSPWTVMLLATPLVWLLASWSWRFVESPALRLATPGRPGTRGSPQERAEPCLQSAGERFQSP